MDDDDEFFDTLSLNSQYSLAAKKRSNNKDYMSLSRNTIYHSAYDLDVEMQNLGGINRNRFKKVSNNPKAVTYKEWRDRNWRSFSKDEHNVDFVLAYSNSNDESCLCKRKIFEEHLKNAGLILEKEESQRIHFIKIHAPTDIVAQYAELLKIRMPIKGEQFHVERNAVSKFIKRILDIGNFRMDEKKFPTRSYKLSAEFSRDKCYMFDTEDPNFFDCSIRIAVISYILQNEKFGHEEQDRGLKKLLADDVYKAAYPLHDGDIMQEGSKRKLLLDEWASVSKWIKYQPIDDIKDYFGVKFALYFTWLGFYTNMLIPASIVGIFCIIYGAFTLKSDTLSNDICTKHITMCPLCDKYCNYWDLSDTCTYSKIAHFIDNPATVFFAVFMSIWATLYLELWKRYSAEITHRWGLAGFDLQAEPPRPEYLTKLAKSKKKKKNPITMIEEPSVPFWTKKFPSIVLSFSVALLWVFIALAVVFGIVIYRLSLNTSDALYSDKLSYRIYVVPITAGLLNLVGILILNYLYDKLAARLTEMENQRTQTQYEESLTLKLYMFQFVNYYSCIFYIAFLKGKFVGYPAKYNRLFRKFRQEECNPGGCLMELTIQLAIIMIGKQLIDGIVEMLIPLCLKVYNNFKISTGLERPKSNEEVISCNQWTEDYKLLDFESCSLFLEYLEMILQYGFVTIFVTAFPLAPLFALINNVFEMRLDAKKFIKYYRRPIPQRVKGIGVWMAIMNVIGKISVASNAFILAFSSNFIPKLVYSMKVNQNHTDEGFLEYSLAYFNTSDFQIGTAPEGNFTDVSICRYTEFRNPPDHPFKYKRPIDYWHILAARLAFIVVYQNLVSLLITVIEWAVPDISCKLKDQIKREAYKINETIIKYEAAEKAKEHIKANNRNRESVISTETEYADVNGDIYPDANNGVLLNRTKNPNVQTHVTEL